MAVEVASLKAVLDLDKKGFDSGMSSAQSMLTGLSTAGASAALGALESGASALFNTMADGVSKAADLEAQLDAIGAISGASEEQLAGFKETVNQLGLDPKLKVSAQEAAIAIEELVAAGVSAEDVMNGAARGAVELQNATGGDWAQSAAIAADSMAIFNIQAKDMSKVVDGITAVTVQSKFDVNDYALALAQAGGVAKASGVEFDDFNTAITAISPLFASGSDAGTSFKTMLQRLVPSSKEAKSTMQELGLMTADTTEAIKFLTEKGFAPASATLDDVAVSLQAYAKSAGLSKKETGALADGLVSWNNQFFDTSGNLKSMTEVAGLMQTAFAGLSEEQRNQAMQTLFGTDAMRAAVGLMETGSAGFTKLQATMANTSGADAAAQRMTNLSGQFEILRGIVESLQISFGDKLLPKLTELTTKAQGFASTDGPAFVDALAGIALKIIEFGEMGIPIIFTQLGTTVSGIGQTFTQLNEAIAKTAELFGMSSVKAEKLSAGSILLQAGLAALTAPIDGLNIVLQFLLDNINAGIQNVNNLKTAVMSLASGAGTLKDRILDAGAALANLSIPDWLQPGSPPPLAYALGDIAAGLGAIQAAGDPFGALGGGTTPVATGGGASSTINVNIGGVSATSQTSGDPRMEALRMTMQLLREQLGV